MQLSKLVVPLSVAFLVAVAPLSAQKIIQVSGQPSAFKAAVAKANPGDTLLVAPGRYDSAIITVGLKIVCVDSMNTIIGSPNGGLVIDSVPAGQAVSIHGGVFVAGSRKAGLSILNCLGAVACDAMFNKSELRIRNCSQVSFHLSELDTITIASSTVVFSACTLDADLGLPAVVSKDSDVSIHSGTVVFYSVTPIVQIGGALRMSWVELRTLFAPTIAVVQSIGGTMQHDHVSTGYPWAPPIFSGTATVTAEPIPTISFQRVTPLVALHGLSRAASGSTVYTVASLAVPIQATPFGALWVGPSAVTIGSGLERQVFDIQIPIGIPPGLTLVLQAASVTSQGQFRLGLPVTTVLYR